MYFATVYFNKQHQKKAYAETSCKAQNSSFSKITKFNEIEDQCHVIIIYIYIYIYISHLSKENSIGSHEDFQNRPKDE